MSDWTEDSLGHLAKIEIGGTPSRDVEAFWASENENGHPWVSIADLGPRYVSTTKERITDLGVLSSNVKPVGRGTLLMSFKLTIGRAGIADCDLFTNEAIAAVVPEQHTLDSSFLYHLLPPIARRAVTDTAIKGSTLNKQTLARLKLCFPKDVRHQRRIAEILCTVDEVIEQTEALIAKYQQIKAGLMHDLFTRGVTPDGPLRSTYKQAPHLYKESPLGWIPKEWDVSKLRDKSSPVRPHIKTGPFGSSLKGEHWVENGRPVITIGALGEGELLTEGLLFVSEATAHRLREYQLQRGDVVFSRVADVGRSAVICEEHDGWIMSSNLMRISLNQNLIVPGYLQAQFAFDYRVKAQIRAKVNSGGRDVANGQILNQLQFAWPRRDEQEIALNRIRALDTNRRSLTDRRTKLLKLRHGLMQDLLTGRVRVKVAETASI